MGYPEDDWEEELVWYPGEKICDKYPKTDVQKKQKKINNLVKKDEFIHTERYFTAAMLEDRDEITKRTRGAKPEN